MPTSHFGSRGLVIAALATLCMFRAGSLHASPTEKSFGSFGIQSAVTLPGTPEEIYDAVTGDISGWWDHSISEEPARFFIEPKPGGGFWEYFDDEGNNGVRHATVIYADRGKLLRLHGPLGLTGMAIDCVFTLSFQEDGSATVLEMTGNLAGQIDEGTASIVESVWDHFLIEQLKPYIEAGHHLK